MERKSNVRTYATTLTELDRKVAIRRWNSKEMREGSQNLIINQTRNE